MRDPHRVGSWGFCPWRLLTGWDCPGCGGLRAVNDLDHGHVVAALHSNALVVGSLPFAALGWSWWAWRAWRARTAPTARPPRMRPWVLGVAAASYGVLAGAFALYRNTAWGAWARAD